MNKKFIIFVQSSIVLQVLSEELISSFKSWKWQKVYNTELGGSTGVQIKATVKKAGNKRFI
jgi:hypothetical protein